MADDSTISQFLTFSGSTDPSVATQYLEMSNNNLEMAVSLYMDHNGGTGGGITGGGGGVGSGAAAAGVGLGGGGGDTSGDAAMAAALSQQQQQQGVDQVRAPDATRSMRLLGGPDSPHRGGGGGGNPYGGIPGLPPGVGAFANGREPPAALLAALGGPAAREMMNNMAMANNGMGGGGMNNDDVMMGTMGSSWAAAAGDSAATSARGGSSGDAGRRGSGTNRRSRSGSSNAAASGGGGGGNNSRRSNDSTQRRNRSSNNNNDEDSDDDEVQVVDANGNAMDEDDDDEYNYNYDDSDDDNNDDNDDDSHDLGGATSTTSRGGGATTQPPSLQTMFAPPSHLIHLAGGFMGAKNFAKDARRWLLVNIQSEEDFACHALNRDVWRDELVENLVRDGFILFQAMSHSNEGQTYIQRYKVQGYPHLAILDPRTGSLLWKKEGWTQVDPLTAEQFVEIASDFCSKHSFDKMPMAARNAYGSGGVALGASGVGGDSSSGNKRPIHELTEEEQLQAAIRASMAESAGGGDDDEKASDSDVEVIDEMDNAKKPSAKDDDGTNTMNDDNTNKDDNVSESSAFEKEILTLEVGDEPTSGDNIARVQIRMPDGKRLVRKFAGDSPVKVIYAFVAQNNDDAKNGKAFELKAKFPPIDLFANIDDGIKSTGLNGEAINVIWK